jgi:hypothetical protein
MQKKKKKHKKKCAARLKFSYHRVSYDVLNCNHETDNAILKQPFLHDKENTAKVSGSHEIGGRQS